MNFKRKMQCTPPWVSLVVACLYFFLWVVGVLQIYTAWHATDREIFNEWVVRTSFLVQSVLYLFEALVALLLDRATMMGWRPLDYLMHHTLIGTFGVLTLAVLPPGCFRFSFPLALLTCLNEAFAAARVCGVPPWPNYYLRVYVLILMLVFVPSLTMEAIQVLVRGDTSVAIACSVLGIAGSAVTYQTAVVIPVTWKMLRNPRDRDS